MIPHRGTEITEKKQCLRVLRGFVWDIGHTGTYDPTQRHGDHREKTVIRECLRVPCGFVWDIGHTGTAAIP